ncbi:MAG: DNA-binding protein [Gammaproteobacteria bacterium]|nr:DNA-binding protein [Gammaproteobacteria bacterium]
MATEADTPRRRFIAGARCPECGAEDRIVTFEARGTPVMECVDCGYRRSEAQLIARMSPGEDL